MAKLKREISSEEVKLDNFVEERLVKDRILIPTFQRKFVWDPEQIKKLWDSMYKFYPIGSILYWVTDSYLNTHRKLGGFEFPHDEDTVRKFKEWAYILDGQQRATSLLVSLIGGKGKIEGEEEFDYTLYFDATNGDFFFKKDFDKRKNKVNEKFLIRLRDVPDWDLSFYKSIAGEEGYNDTIERNLEKLQHLFMDYRLVLIKIQGVEVSEVCEIFERINQEGKRLDPVDIIVARTYRNEDKEKGVEPFYLRDNLEETKEVFNSQAGANRYADLGDYTIIQMVSICLRKEEKTARKSFGITPKALENLSTEVLEKNWAECKKTVFETIKFLCNIKVKGPDLIPYIYLLFPICYHLHKNKAPNWAFCKQWFYRTAFGVEDFRRADEVYGYCTTLFDSVEKGSSVALPKLTLSKNKLIKTSYQYRNALSRAVLTFLAKQNPIDFEHADAEVLDNVYADLSHAPNLHHIYPDNFLKNLTDKESIDSLMNICFLRRKTNIQISDENPLIYFKKYRDDFENKYKSSFDPVLDSHLIPKEYVEKDEFQIENYEGFLSRRAELFCAKLKEELPDVEIEITE